MSLRLKFESNKKENRFSRQFSIKENRKRIIICFFLGEDMETGEVNRQARGGARGSLGGGNPITADQLASAIASAQSVLGMAPPPPSPGK